MFADWYYVATTVKNQHSLDDSRAQNDLFGEGSFCGFLEINEKLTRAEASVILLFTECGFCCYALLDFS